MSNSATIHGFEFSVETAGFAHHEKDRDLCIQRLWDAMKRLKPATIAELHADLLMFANNDAVVNYPQRAGRLCHAAISTSCWRWHQTGDLWLNLSAIPPA